MGRLVLRDSAPTVRRIRCNTARHKLRATMPEQWRAALDTAIAWPGQVAPVPGLIGDWSGWPGADVDALLGRIAAFKAAHGDAVRWMLSDSDIKDRARKMAGDVQAMLDAAQDVTGRALLPQARLDLCLSALDALGIEHPRALTVDGAINRCLSADWWRRVLRRHVARVTEHGAIKLGLVSAVGGAYASDGAVKRRAEQQAASAAYLASKSLVNEAGQSFTLAHLAKASVSNPEVRRGELMTRIRGCEQYAQQNGHRAVFITATAPSRFHAMKSDGRGGVLKNPAYDDRQTPRDAQAWHCAMWAKTRAEWARRGVRVYGFRVAEPHHDGTPHWHLLLWFPDGTGRGSDLFERKRSALHVMADYWLSDSGNEPGAALHRFKVKRMTAGGAAGYIAKYISKNISGGGIGDDELGGHTDELPEGARQVVTGQVQGAARVDAWAAHWGIRQFQAIGQPPVTVWRELRRVDRGQVEDARVRGDRDAWALYGAVHKREGAAPAGAGPDHKVTSIAADWCLYMARQGGACLNRAAYAARLYVDKVRAVNQYREEVQRRNVWGVITRAGTVLVSRVRSWFSSSDARADIQAQGQGPDAWTRFNNCTARLGGKLRAAFMAGGWGAAIEGGKS